MKTLRLWKATKEVVSKLGADEPLQLAASLSYYTLLSLAPLVLVVVAVASLAFGRQAVEGRIVAEMDGLVGTAGAEVIQSVLQNAEGPEKGIVSLAIGLFTLFLGATSVFVQLQSALNRIWEVEAKPASKKGHVLWVFARDRLLSLAMILGVGFLLLVSLLVSAALSATGDWLDHRVSFDPFFWRALDTLLGLGVITLLIAMIFKFLPDVEIGWRDVWFGAVVTALLFTFGKYLIGLYLGRASIGSAYGAAGSVVVLMAWIYYASLIFFLGAEITQVRTRRKRGRPIPVEYAMPASPRPQS